MLDAFLLGCSNIASRTDDGRKQKKHLLFEKWHGTTASIIQCQEAQLHLRTLRARSPWTPLMASISSQKYDASPWPIPSLIISCMKANLLVILFQVSASCLITSRSKPHISRKWSSSGPNDGTTTVVAIKVAVCKILPVMSRTFIGTWWTWQGLWFVPEFEAIGVLLLPDNQSVLGTSN